MPILTRKLKNLPAATILSDTDIFVNEDDTTTQKVTFYQLINFICNHSIIKNAFASKISFDSHVSDKVMHITASERESWDSAFEEKHSHQNKDVLDAITEAKVEAWDSLVVSGGTSHTHINKAILDGITQERVDGWDKAANYEIIATSEPTEQVVNGHWLQPY